jgi:hypothetical protein
MSAQPLFDIFRAVSELMVTEAENKLSPKDIETARRILKQTATRYQDAVKQRNDWLHGTWYIGWRSPEQDDFSDMAVFK